MSTILGKEFALFCDLNPDDMSSSKARWASVRVSLSDLSHPQGDQFRTETIEINESSDPADLARQLLPVMKGEKNKGAYHERIQLQATISSHLNDLLRTHISHSREQNKTVAKALNLHRQKLKKAVDLLKALEFEKKEALEKSKTLHQRLEEVAKEEKDRAAQEKELGLEIRRLEDLLADFFSSKTGGGNSVADAEEIFV